MVVEVAANKSTASARLKDLAGPSFKTRLRIQFYFSGSRLLESCYSRNELVTKRVCKHPLSDSFRCCTSVVWGMTARRSTKCTQWLVQLHSGALSC